MTAKRKRIYEIIIFSLVIILTSLCAYMGITAVQKQMKLNMSFQMNPSIYVKVEIYNTSTSKYETIFQNTNATEIKSGVILSGNTLQFANDYATTLGTSLKMKVTSLNEGITMLTEFSGASVTSGGNTITATATTYNVASDELTVSTLSNLTIQFSQAFTVDVSGVDTNSATISAGQNVYTINGTYYVKNTATNAQFTLTSKEHYETPPAISSITGATYTFTNNNTITLTKINGNVSINASADPSSYTITYNTDGGSAVSAQNYTYKADITLAAAPTKASYDFNGWKVSATVGSWTLGTTYTAGQTITDDMHGNVTLVAQWKAKSFTIYSSINGTTTTLTTYTPSASSQPKTVPYQTASGFTSLNGWCAPTDGCTISGTTLTIPANHTGDITLYPLGYTIGTYTNDSTDVAYNAAYSVENLKATEIYYSPFVGYKYIQFNGASSYLDDDGTTTRHLRWIIIGSATGDTTKYGEGGDENPYTLDSSGNETTTKELLDNECLMLSEQVIEAKAFDASKTSAQWNADTSDIRIWLNEDFLTSTGLTNYKGSKIKPKDLYTSFRTNRDETSKNATYTSSNDYMFLLAHHYNATASTKYASYYLQDYMMERYLGDASNGKIHTFSGATISYWWLRSGYYSSTNRAYGVSNRGYVEYYSLNLGSGVHPSFVFNLA